MTIEANKIMDPDMYLKKHHVMTYINDVVSFLLERKDEDPKIRPYELLAEYFKSIKVGTHILFREYSFISATPHNRACFIKTFQSTYAEIATKGELMQGVEYLSLLRLLCSDFPKEMVENVTKYLFGQIAMENLMLFPDFLYTFQTVFYYECFIGRCKMICSDIASGQSPQPLLRSTVFVSIPSLSAQESASRPVTAASQLDSERILSKQSGPNSGSELFNEDVSDDSFMKAAVNLIQRMQEKEPWQSCPSVDTLKEVAGNMPRFSFCNFVLALSRNGRVNTGIGVLPAAATEYTGSSWS